MDAVAAWQMRATMTGFGFAPVAVAVGSVVIIRGDLAQAA